MTIHNTKGLEFDTVILPHLEKGSGKNDKTLLTWLERPLANNTTALILAPLPAVGDEEDQISKHIHWQDKNKTRHEQGRLLYVAATRAKKALHLCLALEVNDNGEYKSPTDNSLLRKLWPAIKDKISYHPALSNLTLKSRNESPELKRLTTTWKHPLVSKPIMERPPHNKIQGFQLAANDALVVGTLIHALLQQISQQGFNWWTEKTLEHQQQYLNRQLIQAGLAPTLHTAAQEKVLKAIHNTLKDPRGQWVLKNHEAAQAELALSTVIKEEVKMLVIDRTFIDESNQRWIIDYKTSSPGNQDLTTFLQLEKEKYSEQLQQYSEAIRTLDQRPAHLGLYFPLVPAWCEWSAS